VAFLDHLLVSLTPTSLHIDLHEITCSDSHEVTNTGGCLADIWPPSHRSVPFALFTTGSSLGPVIAPIIGGFISQVSLSQQVKY
jgi:hypothetical protein